MTNNIVTAPASVWIDAHASPPAYGSKVLGLSIGGKLCEIVWNSESIKHFDAFCAYPKIPQSIKERQLARFSPSEHI